MTHYICTGNCKGVLPDIGFCEAENCTAQWQMMTACECNDGLHFAAEPELLVKDSNGTVLQTGDSVVLIKDLPLRGSSQVLKRGIKATNIKLTSNPEEIDCKLNGTAIVLRVEFVKKV